MTYDLGAVKLFCRRGMTTRVGEQEKIGLTDVTEDADVVNCHELKKSYVRSRQRGEVCNIH